MNNKVQDYQIYTNENYTCLKKYLLRYGFCWVSVFFDKNQVKLSRKEIYLDFIL